MVPRENSYRGKLLAMSELVGFLIKLFWDACIQVCKYMQRNQLKLVLFHPCLWMVILWIPRSSVILNRPLIHYKVSEMEIILVSMGSFTVPPFRAVDEIPRWVPLWFPAGGKAHAYNILGGKSVLGFEMSRDNQQKINEIKNEIEELKITTSSLQDEIASVGLKLAAKTELKNRFDKSHPQL